MVKPVILCVDDEKIILSSLKEQLQIAVGDRFNIEQAESGEEALELLQELRDDGVDIPLVIVDQIMGGMYGDELLRHCKAILPQTLGIMLTGQATAESVGQALNKAGLFRYLAKPWEEDDLLLTVQSGLDSYYWRRDYERQQDCQQRLSRVIELVLAPLRLSEQLHTALGIVLETPCFAHRTQGGIYLLPSANESAAHGQWVAQYHMPSDEVCQAAVPEQWVFDTDFVYVADPAQSPYPAAQGKLYRVIITLPEQVLGLMDLFVDSRHAHHPYLNNFLSALADTLAGMIRLAQYHEALQQHNERLEATVAARTAELHQALKMQEQLNDILIGANKKLDHYATTDDLTGLLNRRSFFSRADQEAARAQRYQRPASLAMLDVDLFKEVNDSLGHQAGDKVLAQVAHVIRDQLREHDIVGRVGGEEFAIFMPETDQEQCQELGERIRVAVADTVVEINAQRVSVTLSMGLSVLKDEESSISRAMSRADRALYECKDKGRNCVTFAGQD